ncbi:hypothetical protein C9427_30575 [Mesorhizobium helmanticense]|uniref:Uncharacterized protein n=1 Tax=Mesorhizobium helmanticense TaxID=1776423 RepID=A0A2T4ILU1_9HYPH|nr:hypothetical protein C9427_30575 [Mesorhizobium helmanticense]
MFAIEGWDIRGFPEDDAPSDAAHMAAQIWSDAEDAAVEACCAGWTDDKKPVTSVMELLEDPETQLADRETRWQSFACLPTRQMATVNFWIPMSALWLGGLPPISKTTMAWSGIWSAT